MKERPILFSAPMVRALLDGSKTQTRRVIKDQSIGERFSHMTEDGRAHLEWLGTPCCGTGVWDVPEYSAQVACPYGGIGDQLWVRETFRGCRAYEVQGYPPKDWGNKPIWFEADGAPPGRPDQWASRSRPSIHMPRWASRITLEITGVRVERLQDISEADALAEGVPNSLHLSGGRFARENFAHLWWAIHGDDAWDANPLVWVVEFKPATATR